MKDKEKKLRLLHLEERGLKPTIAILKNILQLGVFSRTFMLKEHDLMLKDITLGIGKYSEYSIVKLPLSRKHPSSWMRQLMEAG